jgi:Tfp pilus assembly protein PilZ
MDVGSVVVMKLLLPEHEDPVAVNARIVHVTQTGPRHAPWSEPGIGLQFIDGDDAFRTRVERFLDRIASSKRR